MGKLYDSYTLNHKITSYNIATQKSSKICSMALTVVPQPPHSIFRCLTTNLVHVIHYYDGQCVPASMRHHRSCQSTRTEEQKCIYDTGHQNIDP